MIGVGVQEIQHLADIRNARRIIAAATSLREQSLTLAVLEPREQGGEDIGGLDTGGSGAGAVGVEILVDVEDEVVGAAVRVGDAGEGGG